MCYGAKTKWHMSESLEKQKLAKFKDSIAICGRGNFC
jgi:hypothetical protein